jgi:hypothetical protein
MSAWQPYLPNPDGTPSDHGYLWPWPSGWDTLPPILDGLDGTVRFEDPTSPTGFTWHLYKGSPAWNAWLGQYRPGRVPIVRGGSVSVTPGIVRAQGPTLALDEAFPSVTGEGDPVPEWTNDPKLGVVPIGIPTNQSGLAQAWAAPARLASRLLPVGPVPESVAMGFTALPWLVWGFVAWWVFRRFAR